MLNKLTAPLWRIEPHTAMRVPGLLFADETLLRTMDENVYEQSCNVASLPGIVASACHGTGRNMSRKQATKRWQGQAVIDELAARGIQIRSTSLRGITEEAPGACKDVSAVVDAAEAAGLAKKVVRLEPLICIKG